MWPRPTLSRPIQYSALETQKFGLFAPCTKTITITVVSLWSKSGLRSTLRVSNLQIFLGGISQEPPSIYMLTHAYKQFAPPILNVFRHRCIKLSSAHTFRCGQLLTLAIWCTSFSSAYYFTVILLACVPNNLILRYLIAFCA